MNNEARGIILRIELENFLTYDKVTVHPGRKLNVVIGPNGTGKSTVVCAIVLGLAGNPKLVGRETNVGAYVKEGRDKARIEIVLKDVGSKTISIVRQFDRLNKSIWTLNGKHANQAEVLRLTKSLNIQVDNLCQLLPQDKIQDFAKMNPQDLLTNTQRSVGNAEMINYHEQLKQSRGEGKLLEVEIANATRLLTTERQKVEDMKDRVGNIKERKAFKKKIDTLKQKKNWILYDSSRKELSEVHETRNKVAKEMKKLETDLKPIDREIKKLEEHLNELNKRVELHHTQLSGKANAIQKVAEETCEKIAEIREIEKNREHKIRAQENLKQEINTAMRQKNKLDNDLPGLIDEMGTEETLMMKETETTREIEAKKIALDELTSEKYIYKQQEEALNMELRRYEMNLKEVQNVETKRLDILRQRSQDAYQGVLWLRQNLDQFSAPIHEPMLLLINVKDPVYSKYIESIIPFRDLIAFVCEDKSDMNKLLRQLRGQLKLTVNVAHSDPHRNVRMAPNIPIGDIQHFGFQHYLSTQIEAPETVLKYIVSSYQLQNIPVSSTPLDDKFDRVPKSIRRFFGQDNCYSVNISRYSGDAMTSITNVRSNGMLSASLDRGKMSQITEKIEKVQIKKKRLSEELKHMDTKLNQSTIEFEKVRGVKKELQRKIQTIKQLKSKIEIVTKTIVKLQNDKKSIQEINDAATQKIRKVLEEQYLMWPKYIGLFSKCVDFVTTNESVKFEHRLQRRIVATKQTSCAELREKLLDTERNFKSIERELEPLRIETQKLWDKAKQSTNDITPQQDGFKSFNRAFERLPPTLPEIDDAIMNAQANVYVLDNGERMEDAEVVLRNYEQLQENVEKLKKTIETKTALQANKETRLAEMRAQWLGPLNELLERINANFSTYLSMMDCAGEITLEEGENPDDYDKYGLKIKVKFRDVDELQQLTRQRQSGGERAITTAVYMIALQELSRVPFRCVDEINQGMDSINERRVFELIVQITSNENSPQYFLVTPKLLQNLDYGDDATVHCVFNGSYVPPSSIFDTKRYCEKLTKNGVVRPQNTQ